MSGAAAADHGDHSQWAETSHCRVAGVRHFGAFAALELIAPRVAAPRRARASSSWSRCPAAASCCAGRSRCSPCTATASACSSRRAARAASGSRELDVGETVDLAGPLGSAFPTDGVTNALLVGGGIGCAPLQYLADELAAAGAHVTAAFGFRDFRAARAAGAFSHRAPVGGHARTAASGGAAPSWTSSPPWTSRPAPPCTPAAPRR